MELWNNSEQSFTHTKHFISENYRLYHYFAVTGERNAGISRERKRAMRQRKMKKKHDKKKVNKKTLKLRN